MPELILVKAGKELARLRLGEGEISIGRDASSALVVDDPRVSRKHARVLWQDGAFVYEDAGSSLGSLYKGQEVVSRALADGDAIDLGNCRLYFVARDGAAPAAVAAPAAQPWMIETWPSLEAMLQRADAGRDSARLLGALFEISQTLDSAGEFDDILAQIMDKALTIMEAERGFILLRDSDSGELAIRCARDRGGPISDASAEDASLSLMNRVLDTGEPVLVGDALREPEWKTRSMVANRIHSALCVPLRGGREVGGVIYVDHRSRVEAFTERDLAFFTTFALQAKSAIDSSRSYRRLLDGLFGASSDFVAVCAPDGRITRANRGAVELTGLGAPSLHGRLVAELAAPEDRPAASALIAEIAGKGRAAGLDLRFTAADGRLVPLSLSGFALRDRGGNFAGFCLIGRDRSGETRLIEDLKSTTARLFELNNMKSEFVGMIAHELKGPLSVVIGYSQLLLERGAADPAEPAERRKESLEHIREAAGRAESLIGELLELNRLETGRTELRRTPFDPGRLLLETAQTLSLAAARRKVSVDVRLAGKLPPLDGDENLLRRAFVNLASNGIKYNKEGGRLAITARSSAGRVEISFEDEGMGISERDRKELFKQFFRGEAARGACEGTGLGLSIVKAIVERHGGAVTVQSTLGQGSAFTVSLPA